MTYGIVNNQEEQDQDQEELRLNNDLLDLSLEELGTMSEALGKMIFKGVVWYRIVFDLSMSQNYSLYRDVKLYGDDYKSMKQVKIIENKTKKIPGPGRKVINRRSRVLNFQDQKL